MGCTTSAFNGIALQNRASLYAYPYAKNLRYAMTEEGLIRKSNLIIEGKSAARLFNDIKRYTAVNQISARSEMPNDIRVALVLNGSKVLVGKNKILSINDTSYVLDNTVVSLVRSYLPIGRKKLFNPILE
ncbi:hypothetical protein [Hymenobacter sp. B81]|uniref:hypothetical protein n=1 Tax=Hymenobacter sp. B81 TaxID=3344878 RepID=UPI0037DDB461